MLDLVGGFIFPHCETLVLNQVLITATLVTLLERFFLNVKCFIAQIFNIILGTIVFRF